MQGQCNLSKETVGYPEYEKPALIVKHFLLESGITVLSSDPNGNNGNTGNDNIVDWWT